MGLASAQLRRDRGPLGGSQVTADGPGLDSAGGALIARLALCMAYCVALFLALDSMVVAVRGHSEATESTVYVLAFLAVLPVGVLQAWGVADRLPRDRPLESLAAASLAVSAFGVLLQRLLNGAPIWTGRAALALTVAALVALVLWRGAWAGSVAGWLRGRRAYAVMLAAVAIGLVAAAPGAMFDLGVLGQAALAALLAVGVYRLWRDGGYAVGALLAGVLADLAGVPFAVAAVAAVTFASGVIVLGRMYETLPTGRETAASAQRGSLQNPAAIR